MANEKGQRYVVDGFVFTDEEVAMQAKKELEGIRYIREQTDMENPELVLEVYRRVLAEELFETPVGIHFLREIQDYLTTIPSIRNEGIEPLPVPYQVKRAPEKKREEIKQPKKAEVRETHINYKKRYKMLLPMCIALFVIIVAMFAIEATTNSPNILNYENEIINRYEEWEEQLEEKEKELRERERMLESVNE